MTNRLARVHEYRPVRFNAESNHAFERCWIPPIETLRISIELAEAGCSIFETPACVGHTVFCGRHNDAQPGQPIRKLSDRFSHVCVVLPADPAVRPWEAAQHRALDT